MAQIKLMTKHRYGNIQACVDGTMTASFIVRPKDYGLRALDDKREVREDHEILAQAVPKGHSLLLGLQVPLLDSDVRDRMLDGVDLNKSRSYIEEAAESYRRIRKYSIGNRLHTITIPLGKAGSIVDRKLGRKATTQHRDENDLDYWNEQADAFVDRLTGTFDLTPVPEDFLPYVWNHNLTRGISAVPLPLHPGKDGAPLTHDRALHHFRPAAIDEGGRGVSKLSDWRSWFSPYIQVVPADGTSESSFQTLLTAEKYPYFGAWFPGGSEFLSTLDGLHGVSADWAMRISRTPRDKALDLNKKALRKLNEQAGEREGEEGFADQDISNRYGLLAQYNEILSQRDDSDEIAFTTAIAVGGNSRTNLRRNAAAVRKRMKKLNIKLESPRGGQAELWHMFNPGTPDLTIYRDYAHITTTDMWGGIAPYTTARILDDYGPIIGINLLSGLYEPLHIDFLRATQNDLSACLAIAGELGSGKSYLLKTLCALVVDLNGQFLAFDRSTVGEWEIFAESIAGSAQVAVLDFSRPKYTIDPLRMLRTERGTEGGIDPKKAAQLTLDTLLPLLDIAPTEARGVALANMLSTEYREAHPWITSLPKLLTHIRDRADRETHLSELHGLAQSMLTIAEDAPALFAEDLPGLPLDAAATIMRTHNLDLPSAEQLSNEAKARRLRVPQRLGQAYYTFGGLVARSAFLRPNGRFGALAGDEAHHFTGTDVGPDTLEHFVRDGRKHQAACFLASHDPKADYPGALHELIPMRFAFRHRDKVLARNSLEWLGADLDANPNLVKQMTDNTSPVRGGQKTPEHRRGECFIRDAEGRIGRGKILGPARADRALAVSSSLQDTVKHHGAAS